VLCYQLFPALAAFTAARAAIVSILAVIERKPLIEGMSEDGLKPTDDVRGRVHVKDLYFAYPSRPEAIIARGYNLLIDPGEYLAIVGSSGSGKSTLVSLLLRFYDPMNGGIYLDGRDIRNLNVRWLRSKIG
jgi:ABC-type multidrug transport system fused ATPase/permease subunit